MAPQQKLGLRSQRDCGRHPDYPVDPVFDGPVVAAARPRILLSALCQYQLCKPGTILTHEAITISMGPDTIENDASHRAVRELRNLAQANS